MKTILFVAFLFYRHYSTGGTRRIPYFSTLCALAMIFYIHLVQILIIIDRFDNIIPDDVNESRPTRYLKMGLFFIPIFLVLAYLIKKKELERLTYDKFKIKKGYVFLISYIVLSFIALILLVLYKNGKL